MTAANGATLWFDGLLADLPPPGGRPLAWYLRLDRPEAERYARAASLTLPEIAAFAHVGDALFRIMRRRLAKVLVAKVSGCHPDEVSIGRSATGALRLESPHGWFLSLAGQVPHALIAVGRNPLGVDVEPAEADVPEDSFSPGDRATLGLLGSPLVAGWVAKEAHGKACGQARVLDPRAIELSWGESGLLARSDGARSIVHLNIGDRTCAGIALLEA